MTKKKNKKKPENEEDKEDKEDDEEEGRIIYIFKHLNMYCHLFYLSLGIKVLLS